VTGLSLRSNGEKSMADSKPFLFVPGENFNTK
jgi:hypothetical protein